MISLRRLHWIRILPVLVAPAFCLPSTRSAEASQTPLLSSEVSNEYALAALQQIGSIAESTLAAVRLDSALVAQIFHDYKQENLPVGPVVQQAELPGYIDEILQQHQKSPHPLTPTVRNDAELINASLYAHSDALGSGYVGLVGTLSHMALRLSHAGEHLADDLSIFVNFETADSHIPLHQRTVDQHNINWVQLRQRGMEVMAYPFTKALVTFPGDMSLALAGAGIADIDIAPAQSSVLTAYIPELNYAPHKRQHDGSQDQVHVVVPQYPSTPRFSMVSSSGDLVHMSTEDGKLLHDLLVVEMLTIDGVRVSAQDLYDKLGTRAHASQEHGKVTLRMAGGHVNTQVLHTNAGDLGLTMQRSDKPTPMPKGGRWVSANRPFVGHSWKLSRR